MIMLMGDLGISDSVAFKVNYIILDVDSFSKLLGVS